MKRLFLFLFFVLILVVGAIHAADNTGVSLAVVGGLYTPEMQIYRRGLETKVDKLVWQYGRMSKFMTFIDAKKYKESGQFASLASTLKPEQAFIHVVQDFEKKGGTEMDIPLIRPLTAQGVTGAQAVKGTGERRTIFSKKLHINLKRHAIQIRDNEMSEIALNPQIRMSLMEKGSADLQDWFTRFIAFDPYLCTLQGYGDNLINPADTTKGVGVSAKSHPNSYVAGTNLNLTGTRFDTSSGSHVAYTFDAAWETALATALTAQTDTSDCWMSVQTIRDMIFLARAHKIVPVMTKNNTPMYVIFIDSAQARQLKSDPEYKELHQYAAARGYENALFTGAIEGFPLEGAFIIVDDTIPGARVDGDTDTTVFGTAYSSARGTVNYGVADFMLNPVDLSPRKPAILYGVGAIVAGQVRGFKLTEEMDDHEAQLEHAGRMIYGFERADIIDDDGYIRTAGLLLENSSSLTMWTYSPNRLTVVGGR